MEHMPGAGGVIAGNHIYGPGCRMAPRSFSPTPYRWPRSWSQGRSFRSAKFQWLGTYDAIAHTMAIWHEAQVNTIDDLRTKPLTFGSFAKAHLTYQWPSMTKYVLGANFKVITGYRSGSDCNLAMERGEIQGWENLAGTRPQWLTEKKVSVLLSFTLERKGQLPDVPTLLELAPPDKKDIVEFLAAGTPRPRHGGGSGRPDRVAVLRKAFDGLMKDQAFLADDAQKRNIDIDPRNAAHAHALANAHLRLARPSDTREEGDRAGGVAAPPADRRRRGLDHAGDDR